MLPNIQWQHEALIRHHNVFPKLIWNSSCTSFLYWLQTFNWKFFGTPCEITITSPSKQNFDNQVPCPVKYDCQLQRVRSNSFQRKTTITSAIITLHKCHLKYAQHPRTWSHLLADSCLQPIAVYVYISMHSTYSSCFFLNKYNFILMLASTVFKEYFIDTTEDIGCWFSSIDMIVYTCNKKCW
jgi:hypothetical protein